MEGFVRGTPPPIYYKEREDKEQYSHKSLCTHQECREYSLGLEEYSFGWDVVTHPPLSFSFSFSSSSSSSIVQVFTADHVIVAVPLTILQQGDIAFEPPLPERKQYAIQSLGMEAGAKVSHAALHLLALHLFLLVR